MRRRLHNQPVKPQVKQLSLHCIFLNLNLMGMVSSFLTTQRSKEAQEFFGSLFVTLNKLQLCGWV